MGVSDRTINDVVNRKRCFARAGIVKDIVFDLKCDRMDREFSIPFRKQITARRKKPCIAA